MRHFLIGGFALAALAWGSPALADSVPKLDVEQTCRSAQRADVSSTGTTNYDGCLRSEREAEAEARRRWGDYTAASKAQCSSQFKAGGAPSYVEMVTCLELASGTAPTQTDANGRPMAPRESAKDGKAAGGLTQEPEPSQRTDPMKVLEGK